jgi:hypothetical protein
MCDCEGTSQLSGKCILLYLESQVGIEMTSWVGRIYSTTIWKSHLEKELIGWEENADFLTSLFPAPFLQVMALSILARKCVGIKLQ